LDGKHLFYASSTTYFGKLLNFNLPPFTLDIHDNWEYGWAENSCVRLNVTKADDDQTVQQWMQDCPRGVNYQVIVSAASEPPGMLELVSRVLAAPVHRYAQTP
jgi:hypothetical protein